MSDICAEGKPQPLTREGVKRAIAEDNRRRDSGEYDRPQTYIVSPSDYERWQAEKESRKRPMRFANSSHLTVRQVYPSQLIDPDAPAWRSSGMQREELIATCQLALSDMWAGYTKGWR